MNPKNLNRGIRRQLEKAKGNAQREIAANSVGKYGSGLASEGYAGGYLQALRDVELSLNGIPLYNSRYWPQPKKEPT